jgi:hypothetical protein
MILFAYIIFGVVSQAIVNRHREYLGKKGLHHDGEEYCGFVWFFQLWVWPFIAAHHWATHAVDLFFKKDDK